MRLRAWTKFPTAWIENGGLRHFSWKHGQGSAHTAALMVLLALAHHIDNETGIITRTYDQLQHATELSRTSIANGLKILMGLGLLRRLPEARSRYQLMQFNSMAYWGKLPCRGLYRERRIEFFKDFHLRAKAELEALKLYLLLVARRDNASNMIRLTYDTIEARSGIPRNRIKTALSLLINHGLVHVERQQSESQDNRYANVYRLAHLDPYLHAGTIGRADTSDHTAA